MHLYEPWSDKLVLVESPALCYERGINAGGFKLSIWAKVKCFGRNSRTCCCWAIVSPSSSSCWLCSSYRDGQHIWVAVHIVNHSIKWVMSWQTRVVKKQYTHTHAYMLCTSCKTKLWVLVARGRFTFCYLCTSLFKQNQTNYTVTATSTISKSFFTPAVILLIAHRLYNPFPHISQIFVSEICPIVTKTKPRPCRNNREMHDFLFTCCALIEWQRTTILFCASDEVSPIVCG